MKILYPDGNDLRLLRFDEDQHKLPGKRCHDHRCSGTKTDRDPHCQAETIFDTVRFSRSIILRNVRGKRIAEILCRHIGKGINLYYCCKGCRG